MKGALIFDIETSGLGEGQSIFEAALKDISGNREIEYYIAPGRVIEDEFRYTYSGKKMRSYAQDWSKARMEPGEQFAYLDDYFANKANIDTVRKTGSVKVGRRTYLSPEEFFKKFAKDIKGGRALYVANINFENKALAELLDTVSRGTQAEVKEAFQSYSSTSNKFLYKDTHIHSAIGRAMKSGTAEDWSKVGTRMRSSMPEGVGVLKRDIQDLGRSLLAETKLMGYTHTMDFFTGQGIEYQKTAYELGAHTHSALEDVQGEAKLLARQFKASQRLSMLRSGGTGGFLTGLHGLVTGQGVLEDIRAQQRIESVQHLAKSAGLKKQLAHLELYKRGVEGVPDFKYKPKSVDFKAPVTERLQSGWRETEVDVSFRKALPIPREEIGKFIDDADSILHLGQYKDIDARKMYESQIRLAHTDDLLKTWQSDVSTNAAKAWSDKIGTTMAGAKTTSRLGFAKHMIKKFPLHFGAVAAAGLFVAGHIGGSDYENYDQTSTAPETGLRSKEGLINVAQAEAHIRERQAEAQSQIRPLSAQETDSFWVGPSQPLEGVKKGANLEKVDLDQFNIQVDDADTLILNRKGLFGGKPTVIRLAGMDAPETEHDILMDPVAPYRQGQQQPWGAQGTQVLQNITDQGNLSLYIDPSQTTYGRHVGHLFSGERNVNLDLVRQGHAAALDYSSDTMTRSNQFYKAESQALSSTQGMWSQPFWQAYAASGQRETFNSLTHSLRIQQDPELASLYQAMWNAMPLKGNDDYHNTIEGMQEGGWAQQMRRELTEFGSGWRGLFGGMASKVISGFKSMAGWTKAAFTVATGRSGLQRRLKPAMLDDLWAKSSFKRKGMIEHTIDDFDFKTWSNADKGLPNTPLLKDLVNPKPFVQEVDNAIYDTVLGTDSLGIAFKHRGVDHVFNVQVPALKKQMPDIAPELDKFVNNSYRVRSNLPSNTGGGLTFTRRGADPGVAIHEFGHAITIGTPEASATSAKVTWKHLSKDKTLRNILSSFNRAIKDNNRTGNIIHELEAEAVHMAYQKRLGGLSKFSYSGYWTRYDPRNMEKAYTSMSKLGDELIDTSDIYKKYASAVPNTSGNDDVANLIEGIPGQGAAAQSRRNMNIPFGSGWHGIETQLPYVLSLTEGSQAKIYEGEVRKGYKHIKHNVYRKGLHAAGIGTPHSMALPGVVKNYRLPKPRITIQTSSTMRSLVDKDISDLLRVQYERKVMDQVRKTNMADMQTNTAAAMFYNAKYGAKGHITS